MATSKTIFENPLSDFYKIFLATIVAFFLMTLTPILNSTLFVLFTIYFLDGGHVYSTLLEVVGDPEEVSKRYVWVVLLGVFFSNLILYVLSESLFFYYLFYFTIFHNMKQGMGITFLYRIGNNKSPALIKKIYYFLTLMPFVIFHIKSPMVTGLLGEAIIKKIDFSLFINPLLQNQLYKIGLGVYVIGLIAIFIYLFAAKNAKGFFSLLFFTAIYAYAFLFSDSELKSYALLIFSHAIPYYFLMKKRIEITHNVSLIKSYGWIFLVLIFAIGGTLDYFQFNLAESVEPFDGLLVALLTTPTISHFIFDGLIWKRGNERFVKFINT